MKKTTMKMILAVLALIAPMLARADLIWYDGFNYPDGFVEYSSGFLWVTNSFGGGGGVNDMYVKNGHLEVSASGGIVSRANDCNRLLSVTNNSVYTNTPQVLYASFTVILTNLPNGPGTYFASFYASQSTGGGYYGRIFAATNGTVLPKTWRLGVSGTASTYNHQYPVDLATNTPYQIVAQLDPVTLKSITLWVNPISPSDPSQSSGDVPTGVTAQLDSFSFRQASTFGNFFAQITNLAMATTFAEAATNVWATNAVPPTITYQPVSITNFVGSSLTLAGLADGQGLGNMAYQWQQNGTNYTGGNGGTANILNISPASTNDSGGFTLIATTPYGLSVTSSIATVLVSGGTNSPSITSQPVSLTNYVGQTATFSVSAISPGSIFYQWKSNSVDIAGANGPSYTLANVLPSYAATYSVALTNDVNTNGVVSSNAVLVVLNPPSVSVAFLRTLVDPNNNYQATNSTQPYQVTGIITTRTNLTTGNTASYYLQDATAGINIFATFGSTFRPAQGDVVTFVGVVSSFSSGLELYADTTDLPYTSYSDLSNNIAALPAPLVIPFTITNDNIPAMNYTVAGRLVEITNVFFGTNAGTTISAPASGVLFVTVTNELGQPFNLVFTSQVADTQGAVLPAYAASVTGVVFGSMNPSSVIGGIANPNFGIVVTDISDINVPVLSIPLDIAYSAGSLTFNWTDPTFSLQYATNVLGPYITIDGAVSGFSTNTTDQPQLFFRLSHP